MFPLYVSRVLRLEGRDPPDRTKVKLPLALIAASLASATIFANEDAAAVAVA
jgi:tellurite resistance protein TehA-like permease